MLSEEAKRQIREVCESLREIMTSVNEIEGAMERIHAEVCSVLDESEAKEKLDTGVAIEAFQKIQYIAGTFITKES